ncbi:MAG: hypothetical protein AB7S78_13700 [Candidatus Omnitrophota bacterium]
MIKETCLIDFIDGTSMRFEFQVDGSDTMSVANEIHRIADSPTLCFEIDNKLVFLPTANIRSIEVYPAPAKIPSNVLRGATSLGNRQ